MRIIISSTGVLPKNENGYHSHEGKIPVDPRYAPSQFLNTTLASSQIRLWPVLKYGAGQFSLFLCILICSDNHLIPHLWDTFLSIMFQSPAPTLPGR